MLRIRSSLALLLLLSLPALSAHAATHTWPGTAPCAGTLQACVDAVADGDRIEVTAATIDETIIIQNKSLTLVAANGLTRPTFTAGNSLSISNAATATSPTVTVSGFRFADGSISADYSGTGTATYDIGNMQISGASNDVRGIQIMATAGTLNARVHENYITTLPFSNASGLITLFSLHATLNAWIDYNHLTGTSATLITGAGMRLAYEFSDSEGTTYVHGNEVRSSFSLGGIWATSSGNNAASRIISNVVVGSGATGSLGIQVTYGGASTFNTQILANTVTQVHQGIVFAKYFNADPGAQVTGTVSSNLIRATVGLNIDPSIAPAISNDYNLINASNNNATLGAHTITADARLVADELPRLRADSPAIDAGDTTTVGLGILLYGMPLQDADGLRRFKNPTATGTAKLDIGAYEYGDVTFVHSSSSSNIVSNWSNIHNPATDNQPAANLFVTQNIDASNGNQSIWLDRPLGVWYASPGWTIFDEGGSASPMLSDVYFDVFVPAPGDGVFRHVTTAGNTSGWATTLDDPSVNNDPGKILLVTQNYTAGGQYNPHPVGVSYVALGGQPGTWKIWNID